MIEVWLKVAAISSACFAALILIWFLMARPPLGRGTKLALLLGFGIFPIGAALIGNVSGYERTTERSFCRSCHTMEPWVDDAGDSQSKSLAAVHSRNADFGDKSCYRCHEDYEMFGTIVTKLDGMKHVWMYYTEFHAIPNDAAVRRIKLYEPFPNSTCMHCHSTGTPRWNEVPEHASASKLVRSGQLSCASAGCHGPAHPFAAPPEATHE